MKFSDMLLREDFWKILKDTLNANTQNLGIKGEAKVVDKSSRCTLYANAQLNAIMSMNPSKAVRDYLKTEYTVGGSPLRKMMVKGYLWASTHMVCRFAQKGIEIQFDESIDVNDILIYPCNKKIRIFDFKHGVVHTVLKKDFPDLYIVRETEFRMNHHEDFVPQIQNTGKNYYSEKIINGRPLARIYDASFVEKCQHDAVSKLISLTKENKLVKVTDYLASLKQICLEQLKLKPAFKDCQMIECLFNWLSEVGDDEKLSLVVSHGDFQPGNIWYDDDNKKVVIIDWETVKMRSRFYDHAALYYNLRRSGMLQNVVDRIKASSHIASFTPQCSPASVAKVVMAEELAYQTEELISFPGEIGAKEYEAFINKIKTVKI